MVRKRFDVEVPDGQHLGFSRDTEGAFRAHLFDDEGNRLAGHAELFEPDDDDSSGLHYGYGSDSQAEDDSQLTDEELAEALGALIGLAIIVASLAVEAAPHVSKWWKSQVVPAAKSTWARIESTWNRIPKTLKAETRAANAVKLTLTDSQRGDSSTEVTVALEDYRARMSSAEARERFVAALLARSFSEAQMRMLRTAKIEDADGELELDKAIETLTPHQVGETLKLMLEKNPSLLSSESLGDLGSIFTGARLDEDFMPLRIERIKQASHLTAGNMP